VGAEMIYDSGDFPPDHPSFKVFGRKNIWCY
jgi:hypothetical protein